MKTRSLNQCREHGSVLMMELIAGIFLLMVILLPMGYSFLHESRLFRTEYQRGVAMEIVDGEMEILAAGEWKQFPEGTASYPIKARAAQSLPPGHFQITRTGNHVRLEWQSASGRETVAREAVVK
jgi:hypothetical protein